MKQKVSFLLILALLLCALAGCGSSGPAETEAPQETETAAPQETEEAGTEPEETETSPVFDAELARGRFDPDTPALTVNGVENHWALYFDSLNSYVAYFYGNYGITDLGMQIDEDQTLSDMLRRMVEMDIGNKVMLRTKAEELGITLSEEDLKSIDDEILIYAAAYAGGDTDALFEQMGISEEYYRFGAEAGLYQEKLFEYFYGEGGSALTDEDVLSWAEDNDYLYAKHILFRAVDDNNDPLEEAVIEEKRAQAEDALAQLRAADPSVLPSLFDALMESLSEDPGSASYPDGYYFQAGEMVAPFEEAARSLPVGEISDIVESDYGFHILYRPAMSPDHTAGYDSSYNPITLRETAAEALFDNMQDEWYDALVFEYAEGFEDLDIAALYEEET